jgi:hypothetical protein
LNQRNFQKICSILCIALLAAPVLPARTDRVMCGTEKGNWREELHLNRMATRARLTGRLTTRGAAVVDRTARTRDVGDLVVMDDSGGVIARRNPFNLVGRSLTFTPAASDGASYGLTVGDVAYDTTAEAGGEILDGLGDDDYRTVPLPFDFNYFGRTRNQMLVHSDGNVTFDRPDTTTAARSLGRLTAGPPRIAPLFADLDPTNVNCDVRVWTGEDRVVVTWRNVPEYSDFGTGSRQYVQMALYTNGRISFQYRQASASSIVVGISPGGPAGQTDVISLRGGSSQIFTGAVAESFGSTDGVDTVRVAQRLYEDHEDSYDYLVIFNTAGVEAGTNAVANELTVRNYRQGLGDTQLDVGESYGSSYRLQAVLNMGPLSQYPQDPYARVGSRGAITGDNTMTILGHETGHLFLALASIRDPLNPSARPMLGTQNAHWSFNFNSEASLLEGNRIQDNGPTVTNRFYTVATVEGYAPLDQYLMGFREAKDVPATFLVRNSNYAATNFPQVGVNIRGTRQDITVDDVIAAEGVRVPDATVAQRHFRFVFVLITPSGTEPTEQELAKLENFRSEFERFYARAAQERATADSRLRRMVRLSTWPAAGVLAGEDGLATVELAAPAEEDLTFAISTDTSLLTAPETVTVPQGYTGASFALHGVAGGASDLVLQASDERYETPRNRISVADTREKLRLLHYYRDGTLLVLRVTDPNELNYSNVRVLVDGREEEIRTDARGLVWLEWDGVAELTAEIEGAPGSRLVVPADRGE